jgi:hypothetical protein
MTLINSRLLAARAGAMTTLVKTALFSVVLLVLAAVRRGPTERIQEFAAEMVQLKADICMEDSQCPHSCAS